MEVLNTVGHGFHEKIYEKLEWKRVVLQTR